MTSIETGSGLALLSASKIEMEGIRLAGYDISPADNNTNPLRINPLMQYFPDHRPKPTVASSKNPKPSPPMHSTRRSATREKAFTPSDASSIVEPDPISQVWDAQQSPTGQDRIGCPGQASQDAASG
ncbi:MAG: hypothetical protein ISN28_12300 [Ectothiorhodospiraceae bacterium AqS1]|nr:hypothetical protein [Ectothiorhodospiraceae bacterium AqS1]MBF2761020.1 hypothetical protein [Ectothiorhodospiraceae bacterium AqS1]